MAASGQLIVLFLRMTSTQRFDQEQTRQEAALWLSRLQLGTADEAAFARWRDEHPAHALEFARVFAHWEALGNAVSADDLHKPAVTFTRRQLLGVGGVLATVAFGGAFWVSQYYGWTRIRTAVGEYRKLRLPDTRIVVELNTDTEMSWRLDGKRTLLRLARGEVAVTLPGGVSARLLSEALNATLLAGIYNARYLSDLLRLTVKQGSALLDTAATASAGQTVTAAAADRTYKIEREDNMDASTAWRNGEIVFHEESLVAAVAEYNRYLTKKIKLIAPKAQFQRVGGRFTTTSPQAFLRAVSLALDLQSTETDANYLLTPKI
jgi:transmembrane sensor